MPAPELLHNLLTAPGPPGHESRPARVWREAAEGFADEVTTDKLGTTVARVNGRGDSPLMVVVGHIDEIALLVSHVSDKGFLHVVQSGGWDAQVLVGQRVEVLTREGVVPGVVGRKPPHLTDPEERKKAVELKRLSVDIGAGRVTVNGASGSIAIDTGSGEVDLRDVHGGRIDVDTGSGP